MKELREIKEFEVLPGARIDEAAKEALKIAEYNNCIVKFEFNSVNLRVTSWDTVDQIVSRFYKGEK